MNKISGVYLIRNTITNDCYVGSSVDVKRRWANHKSPSKWKQRPNSLLYKAFQKYELSNFTFEILEECNKSQLFIREQYYINKLSPTYNTNRAFQTEEEYKVKNSELTRQWYQAHKEQHKELAKKWKQTHKEHYYNTNKQWRESHREQRNEYMKQYMRQYYHKRKAAKQVEPTK